MTDRPTVFCKDCKFRPWSLELGKCKHNAAIRLGDNYLTDSKPGREYCSSMRGFGAKCGPDGKLWEPRK